VSLPARVSEVLVAWDVAPAVRARLAELHVFLGEPAFDAFVRLAEACGRAPRDIEPEELDAVRALAGEAYLLRHHGDWVAGRPTPGFWRDRTLEGATAGLVTPLGDLSAPASAFLGDMREACVRATGPDQPRPQGLLLVSRNAHYGNRPDDLSVDLVPSDVEQALILNRCVGQQHTLPGSIGETSGTAIADPPIAVMWEVQPNVYKPSPDRNREANATWRRHRNWNVITATSAFAWLRENTYTTFVLRSEALQLAHEVNPGKPVTADIEAMHDRTIGAALAALGLRREPCEAHEHADVLRRVLDRTLSHRRGDRSLGSLLDRVVAAATPRGG
jgi:hypothetical protein